jgi:hypothetical protein
MGLLSTLEEVKILDQKVAFNLPLNERGGYAKFGFTGSYKEQTNKLSSRYIYIYR